MSGFKTARVGDIGTHNAKIITGDETHIVNDKKQSRVGDLVNCPIHGVNKIIAESALIVINENRKTAHKVSICKCGAKILTGSEDFIIDIIPDGPNPEFPNTNE